MLSFLPCLAGGGRSDPPDERRAAPRSLLGAFVMSAPQMKQRSSTADQSQKIMALLARSTRPGLWPMGGSPAAVFVIKVPPPCLRFLLVSLASSPVSFSLLRLPPFPLPLLPKRRLSAFPFFLAKFLSPPCPPPSPSPTRTKYSTTSLRTRQGEGGGGRRRRPCLVVTSLLALFGFLG